MAYLGAAGYLCPKSILLHFGKDKIYSMALLSVIKLMSSSLGVPKMERILAS